jgi:Flp pilus assembly secretin CpaC
MLLKMLISIALVSISQIALATEPPRTADDQQRLLQQKCAELDRLQADIEKLREATGTPAQIRVDVQMLEIGLTKLREKGISTDWFATGHISADDLKQAEEGLSNRDLQPKKFNNNLQFVNWLRQENLAKTLADPTVFVVSGQMAELHVGGEFPVPNSDDAKAGVGFRRFGTELKIAASALGDSRVRLNYKAHVSEIDQSHAIEIGGERVPALRVREFDSGCELPFGQTSIMAGLVQQRVEAQELADGQVTEKLVDIGLMIVITPKLVEATEVPAGQAQTRIPAIR